MATVKKRGKSYQIRCYDAYDVHGKQVERTMTWHPPEGMSEKRAEKEAQHQAALFEEQVRNGLVAEEKVKFSVFAERWFNDYAVTQLRPRTLNRYKDLMRRIEPEIGHLYLDKIRPGHLIALYKKLALPQKAVHYRSKADIKAYVQDQGMTQKELAGRAGISVRVMYALSHGDNISASSAKKLAAALGPDAKRLLAPVKEELCLSNKTILHYHRLISSMLHTAVYWQLIPANPAERVQPPKVGRQKALFLDDRQSIRLLELLQDAPMPYRTAITMLLFTGMRRGELLGLKWSDINFEVSTINIERSLLYLSEQGLFEDDTKTDGSHRVIKVPQTAMQVLAEYQKWQQKQRLLMGTAWGNSDYVFTTSEGQTMRPDTLTNWFHAFIIKTDLPPIHLHSLRHTNATLQIANGVPLTTVASNLGHADSSTTTKIYAHAIQSAAAASAEMMDHLLNPVGSQQ